MVSGSSAHKRSPVEVLLRGRKTRHKLLARTPWRTLQQSTCVRMACRGKKGSGKGRGKKAASPDSSSPNPDPATKASRPKKLPKGREILTVMKKPSMKRTPHVAGFPEPAEDHDSTFVWEEPPAEPSKAASPKLPKKAKKSELKAPKHSASCEVPCEAPLTSSKKCPKAAKGRKALKGGPSTSQALAERAAGKVKKTFARRYEPQGGFPLTKWQTLKHIFEGVVKPHLDKPSVHEDMQHQLLNSF